MICFVMLLTFALAATDLVKVSAAMREQCVE